MMCEERCGIQRIMHLLRTIQGKLNCHMQSSAKDFGLTASQFMVMFEIYNNENISLNELSENLELPKSSVSRLVDQLVNQEIVIREIPKENRRTVRLFISPEFLNRADVTEVSNHLNDPIKVSLEPQRAEQIITALEELSEIINK